MPSAEIIAIGTELLLGEIQDTNTRFLARSLRDVGIDLYRTTIIGDNAARITHSVGEALQRADIVITTGGLGPTVDDPTREAIADAFGVDLEFRPELWQQIENRFARMGRKPTDNNKRQAYIPRGAAAIENPVGTAPAFRFESKGRVVISLPGVPREMEYLLENQVIPYLCSRFGLTGTIRARVLHLSGIGESQIDEWIGDLETYGNPTVGLSAHAGQIDVRITAKAPSSEAAEAMLDRMEQTLLSRLGDHVYGIGDISLEEIVREKLKARKWRLALLECGLKADLAGQLFEGAPVENLVFHEGPDFDLEQLELTLKQIHDRHGLECALGVSLKEAPEQQILRMYWISPLGNESVLRSYGGPPSMTAAWSVNTILDFIRRHT